MFAFPPIQKRLGTVGTFRFAVLFYTLGYIIYPITSYVARQRELAQDSSMRSIYTALGCQLFCLAMANLVSYWLHDYVWH